MNPGPYYHISAFDLKPAFSNSIQMLNVDGKSFSLEASASKDELELFVATPIPGIEYLKFETEFSGGKYHVDLEYGKKGTPDHLDVDVELNNKEVDVKYFKFDAKRLASSFC